MIADIKPADLVSLQTLVEKHPDIPPNAIYYFTRKCCQNYAGGILERGAGRRRKALYSLVEFQKARKRWDKRRKLQSDCLSFSERGVTWVAAEKLPGISRETADRFARDGIIDKPRTEYLVGPAPWYRKFWPLEQIEDALAGRAVSRKNLDRLRTPTELAALAAPPAEQMTAQPQEPLDWEKHPACERLAATNPDFPDAHIQAIEQTYDFETSDENSAEVDGQIQAIEQMHGVAKIG